MITESRPLCRPSHMLSGIWQLTRVALRMDSRRIGPHLTRLALGALLLWVVASMEFSRGATIAPGLRLFRSQLAMTHLFLTVDSLFGYSLLLLEEKEAGTLELMRLAGLNSLSVLLGKVLPRLTESFLLLAVQFPFTLMAITLGGLTPDQVIGVYVALLAYLWLAAMIGVWCSIQCQNQWSAVSYAGVALFAYNFPYASVWLGSMFSLGTSSWDRVCLPLRLWAITESGFNESAVGSAVLLAIIAGTMIGLFSWWQLARTMTAPVAASRSKPSRPSQRVWERPLFWKDFSYLMGGRTGLVIRTSLYVAILAWMTTIHDEFPRIAVWTALIGGAVSLIDGTWTASRLFSEEKREQTWSTLVLTPQTVAQLVRDKWNGWLLGHAPSILLPYAFIILAILAFPFSSFGLSIWDCGELIVGSISTGLAIVATLHLLAINSLSWGWKAIPLTLTICCLGAFVFLNSIFPWRYQDATRVVLHGVTAGFMLMLIIAMQFRLIALLHRTAGEDA